MRVHNEVQTDAGNNFKDPSRHRHRYPHAYYIIIAIYSYFKVFFMLKYYLFYKPKSRTNTAPTTLPRHVIYTRIFYVCVSLCVCTAICCSEFTQRRRLQLLFYVCAISRHSQWFVTLLPRHYCSPECTEWATAHASHTSDRYCHFVLLSIVAARVLAAKSTVNFGTTVVGCAKNVRFSLRFVNVHKPNRITGYKRFFFQRHTTICYTVFLGRIERRLLVVI